MSLAHKLLCRITGSSNTGLENGANAKSDMASSSKTEVKKQEGIVKNFVAVSIFFCNFKSGSVSHCLNSRVLDHQEDPQSKYTFDSVERDAPECEFCREGDKLSRKCIQVSSCALVFARPGLHGRYLNLADTHAFNSTVQNHAGSYQCIYHCSRSILRAMR